MINREEILNTMVQVSLKSEEDFLKIKETLTRIGIASMRNKELSQSVHILHKQGKYYLAHFKQLFKMDGKESNFSDDDDDRLHAISSMLHSWGLINLVTPIKQVDEEVFKKVFVIPFKEKSNWILSPKYSIGKKKFTKD